VAPIFPPVALCASGDAQALPHADCYWVWPGRLLAGSHPTSCLRGLLDAGVDSFIDLTCDRPSLAGYATALPAQARWHGFAITDYAVPGVHMMHDIVEAIRTELQRGALVYVHCHAGVGRTGTAIGCWLVEQGLSGPDALASIAHKRSFLARLHAAPESPETAAQRTFVMRWTPRRQGP